jgi:hypothetical protein
MGCPVYGGAACNWRNGISRNGTKERGNPSERNTETRKAIQKQKGNKLQEIIRMPSK